VTDGGWFWRVNDIFIVKKNLFVAWKRRGETGSFKEMGQLISNVGPGWSEVLIMQ
jgi:hypothetical protein